MPPPGRYLITDRYTAPSGCTLWSDVCTSPAVPNPSSDDHELARRSLRLFRILVVRTRRSRVFAGNARRSG